MQGRHEEVKTLNDNPQTDEEYSARALQTL